MKGLTDLEYALLSTSRDKVVLGLLATGGEEAALRSLVSSGLGTWFEVEAAACSCGIPRYHRHLVPTARGLLALRCSEMTRRSAKP